MLEANKIMVFLGGEQVFHHKIISELAFFEIIHAGLPVLAIEKLLKAHMLSKPEIARFVVPLRTLARRKKEKRLSCEESDRLVRLVRMIVYAEEVIGNREKAHAWLRRPNRVLGEKRPIDLLDTESGARMVETILGRIEHGIYT